jgi:hypothetical protein
MGAGGTGEGGREGASTPISRYNSIQSWRMGQGGGREVGGGAEWKERERMEEEEELRMVH